MLEKTLESPSDYKEIKPVNPRGHQFWIFIDVEAETTILWPPDVKSRFLRKDPDIGKDWGQEERGTTEDRTVIWHHQTDGQEFEQALANGDGQQAWHAAVHKGRVGYDQETEQHVYNIWCFLAILSLARLFNSSEFLFTCKSRVTFRVNMIKMIIL